MPGDALDVFVSYSQEDESLRQELEEQLVGLRREGLVRTWHERQITAAGEWRGWINRDLMSSDLILLIVSAPYLASGYCQGAELKCALDRRASGDAEVVPIIARPCDWRSAPFSGLPTLPQDVGPVTEWHSRDGAWEDVAQGIREAATRLRAAWDADPLTGPEGTAPRETDRRAAAPPEGASEARMPRLAILGGFAAVLTTLAAVWFFVVWQPWRVEHGTTPAQASEARPPRDEPGRDLPAAGRRQPAAATATEQPSAPPRPAVTRPTTGPDVAESTPRQLPAEGPPEEEPPETETTSEELAPVTAEAEAEPSGPATADDEIVGPPEPVVELPKPEDFERSLGILAAPGAEAEGECVAVLVADEYVLTSRACAEASNVVVMGGNALTATRDEIIDLEPGQSLRPTDVNLVKLIRGLAEAYGFVATRLEESFDYESLNASYVESSEIRLVECVAEKHLAEMEGGAHAYIENTALDRYLRFVEEAADEAISIAGSRWAEVLPDVLGSSEERLAGFVCGFPHRPPPNLVLSVEGSVVGIGYSCEPFDRMEPEVHENLPPGIRRLELDCIASLAEIRDDLREVQVRSRRPESSD